MLKGGKERAVVKILIYSFFPRLIIIWNSLTQEELADSDSQ